MDDFDILGVSPTASDEEIKKAYKTLMIKWSPDNNPGNEEIATQESQKITVAYTRITKMRKNGPQNNFDNETNFYAQREDLERKRQEIITKQNKLNDYLSKINLTINLYNMEQDEYRDDIQDILKRLIHQIRVYYEGKNHQNNRKIFYSKKLQAELKSEEESITFYLQSIKDKIENHFEKNEDNEVFEISLTEIRGIINNTFPEILAALQKSIEDYKDEYKELTQKKKNAQSEKDKTIEAIRALEQQKAKIEQEINKIDDYYKVNQEQEFKDAWKTGQQAAEKFNFNNDSDSTSFHF